MTGRYRGAVFALAVCLLAAGVPVSAEVLPHGLKIERVLNNTVELGDMAISPSGELWLLQRATGTIRVFVAGREQTTLTIPVMSSCESGLLDVAFGPDYTHDGLAFVYYVDPTGTARVDELWRQADLQIGSQILNVGTTPGGCRPGGGIDVGDDGKLYVAVGDLETSGDAQDDGMLSGKVLRAEPDGSVPVDNPSGTLVWAKGFRNAEDLDIDSNGTVYLADLGVPGSVHDEINAVLEGDNHGWDAVDGDTGGVYDDPLASHLPTVTPEAVTHITGTGLGADHDDTVIYACTAADEMRQLTLTGSQSDQLDEARPFYDPLGDTDGSPDAGCPSRINSLAEGADGSLYAANFGANRGVWRVWPDHPGPREVSADGSPFHMTVDKAGTDLLLGWENLGPLDAGLPTRNAGQHAESYQIWEGTLPITGTYSHVTAETVDGAPDGPGRLTKTVTPGGGDRYYLISAQGDNFEGTLGAASDDTPRTGQQDYCSTIGFGKNIGQCAMEWINPSTGGVLKLRDYNPNSPTYLQQLTMSDFRGKVVRMDLSAKNCTFCNLQADVLDDVELLYHGRDLQVITIMTWSFQTLAAIPPGSCGTVIGDWVNDHGGTSAIFCDTDINNDGKGDVTWQYWNFPCGGTPENYYIDQGNVIYNFVCGGELSASSIVPKIINEVNPESCE